METILEEKNITYISNAAIIIKKMRLLSNAPSLKPQ